MSDIDSWLEMAYEDQSYLEDEFDYPDDGRYDDDPNPYEGTWSED